MTKTKAEEAFEIFKASIERADANHARNTRRIDRQHFWMQMSIGIIVFLAIVVPLIIHAFK